MTATQSFYVSKADTEDYAPFEMNIIDGDTETFVHMLREESGGEGQLLAGMWRAGICTIDYMNAGDETMHIIRGEVEVELDDGDVVKLEAGDIASFSKGTHAIWRISSPIEKVFVISG